MAGSAQTIHDQSSDLESSQCLLYDVSPFDARNRATSYGALWSSLRVLARLCVITASLIRSLPRSPRRHRTVSGADGISGRSGDAGDLP
jgi:hypothetical protein